MTDLKEHHEYIYNRIKYFEIDEETKEESVFLLAGLTKITYRYENNSVRRRVEPIKTKHFELPIHEAPKFHEFIPEGVISVNITKYEYERLLEICDEEPVALFCFNLFKNDD